jgi:hypothetical protein
MSEKPFENAVYKICETPLSWYHAQQIRKDLADFLSRDNRDPSSPAEAEVLDAQAHEERFTPEQLGTRPTTQHSHQRQTATDLTTRPPGTSLEFIYEKVPSSFIDTSRSSSKKRKRATTKDRSSSDRIKLSSHEVCQRIASAIELGGHEFRDKPSYRATWLSSTEPTRPCGETMTLMELSVAYDSYTNSCSLLLQRARLVQCFIALATARKAGRPVDDEERLETSRTEGCSKTKLRRANVGRVLVELMNMLPPHRAYSICVALSGKCVLMSRVCALTGSSCTSGT